jgi:hypothetical protein
MRALRTERKRDSEAAANENDKESKAMKVQLPGDNEGILKASELTSEPWIEYVGTYTDSRNGKESEYKFRAQDDEQAARILKEQTDHWAAVIKPSRSKSFYTDLGVRRA